MFEECLKNVFPDNPLSFYFCAGEGVGVGVLLSELEIHRYSETVGRGLEREG